jgi:hypothetical protein
MKTPMITAKHEPDGGFRFERDGVSLLAHALAMCKAGVRLSTADVNAFFRRVNQYLQSIGAYGEEQQQLSEVLKIDDFRPRKDCTIYKYVKDDVLQCMLGGSFQLGSIQYYRTVEDQNIKDHMEGLSNLIVDARTQVLASLVSGHNFGIFCGTTDVGDYELMSKRFGPRLIRIPSLRRFAEAAQHIFGAQRYLFHPIIYSDLKLFRIRTLKRIELRQGWGMTADNRFDVDAINDRLFSLLYHKSILPSIFMKPTRFDPESEFRLALEFPKDLPTFRRESDEELRRCIEVIK